MFRRIKRGANGSLYVVSYTDSAKEFELTLGRALQAAAVGTSIPILWMRDSEGNASAFEELVKRYDRQLFRIAQTIARRHQDTQNAVEKVLFNAFEKLNGIGGRADHLCKQLSERFGTGLALLSLIVRRESWTS